VYCSASGWDIQSGGGVRWLPDDLLPVAEVLSLSVLGYLVWTSSGAVGNLLGGIRLSFACHGGELQRPSPRTIIPENEPCSSRNPWASVGLNVTAA
jgi:hypothetical protein